MQITDEILKVHNLTKEEYDLICEYIGKTPNLNELGIFSAMWSEHCGYKNTKPLLKKLPTKAKHVVHGPGENAGVVDIGDDDVIAFKIESHNHPSAVEPYQGAATGVGGILRDIFTMGARPIAVLDSLRFGDPSREQTKHLIDGVVRGIGGYGNCMGIPTVSGEVFFEDTYNQNILVNAMCLGLAKKDKIVTSQAYGVGNWLVYYGSTTGRDGVHGASFASAKLEEDEGQRSAIQVGDPFLEKLLLEATLELIDKDLVLAAQDMGAAGLTSTSTEMGSKGENGVRLNLDAIPKRAADITAYEMLLSESQERMVALISPERWDEVKAVLDKWGIHGSIVGEIIPERRFEVHYEGEVVADLPLDAIIEKVPSYTREVLPEPSYFKKLEKVNFDKTVSLEEAFKALISSPNIASKKWVYDQYDYMIGDSTVTRPGVAGASVVRIPGSKKGVAVTTDCNSRYIYLNPLKGAHIAVSEAARNISALGAKPLAVTNCLNFGTPTDLDIYYQLFYSLKGMGEACELFETPVTGGNASLYNEGAFGSIYPTPTIGMIGLIEDVDNLMTPAFKEEGDVIYLLGETKDELDATEYAKLFANSIGKDCPDIDLNLEKKTQDFIRELILSKTISSCDDLSLGGLASALLKASAKSSLGLKVNIEGDLSKEALLFSESQSRFLISLKASSEKELLEKAQKASLKLSKLGAVQKDMIEISCKDESVKLSVETIKELYNNSFEKAIS